MQKISLIAALSKNNVIGSKGTLPWHLKNDFDWFIKNTKNKIVIMGRKNYEDIIRYTKGKPLKNRINVVLTTQQNFKNEGFLFFNSIEDILTNFSKEDLMIIGGSQIYNLFLPICNELILTEIHKDFEGDTFFPNWNKKNFQEIFRKPCEEDGIHYDFVIYKRI
jgi:dihydrofolate reductase